MAAASSATDRTVDPQEIARFARIAEEWWDPAGKFRPLHKFNPVRLTYIKRVVSAHFGRDAADPQAFSGLRLLDIGCGGGLLSEPMARLGADVMGVDPSETNIGVARLHAERAGVAVDYRATTAEALADAGERFDVVLAMEVVEHVADVPIFVNLCAGMVRPGGLMLAATINRTPKAYLLAIIGAERILRWLPVGTHSYDRLVRPAELETALAGGGLVVKERTGVVYNPIADRWRTAKDMDVNYMLLAERPAA
jgi:2-polyprenyl-6-hydroxyphenyl methylase/3-demethylubiquinone-9 3-methyltransferase